MTFNKTMKKLSPIIYTLLLLATITGATAFEENLTTLNNYEWVRINSDLMGVNTGGFEISFYSSGGFEKTIDISPYSSSVALHDPAVEQSSGDVYWVCDSANTLVCYVDYSAGTLNTINVSDSYNNFSYTATSGVFSLNAVTDDLFIFDYTNLGVFRGDVFLRNNLSFRTNNLPYPSACVNCGQAGFSSFGGKDYIYHCDSQAGAALHAHRYEYTATNLTDITDYTIAGAGTPWSSLVIMKNAVPEGQYMNCFGSILGQASRVYMPVGSSTTPWPTTLFSTNVNVSWYDANNDDETVTIDATTKEISFFQGTTLINTSLTSSSSYDAYALSNGALLYLSHTNLSNYTWTITDDFATSNDTTNGTFWNITTISNETFTSSTLRTLELLRDEGLAIGLTENSSEKINIYNKTGGTLSFITQINLSDPVYSTSHEEGRIFISGEEGIIVYDNYDTTPLFVDSEKYGILKSDDMEDIVAINNTKAFVCDNNNEPDFYEIGSKPTGSYGGGCYDLEYKDNKLFVDGDDEGVHIYNANDPENLIYIQTIDYRTDNHESNFGDYLDYDDELLVMTNNLYGFTIINTTSLNVVADCNTGLGGKVRSVELIDNNTAVAGLHNGKIAVCDFQTIVGFNFTDNHEISSFNGESIDFIEYDGTYLHLLGAENYYAAITIVQGNLTGNTPPSIDEIVVSDIVPYMNQTITITVTPADVEPEDVIRYGFKCSVNDTSYQENTLGEHDCIYNYSGSETITVAITDNYHLGTWYDVTLINIGIQDTNFTGGLLRVEVVDDETGEYVVNASVTANAKTVFTDSFGRGIITTTTTGDFLTVISKSGYQDYYETMSANGAYNYVRLQPEAVEGQTNLLVTVNDKNGLAVEDALVTFTNTLTYQYDYKYTNANGQAYFADLDSGVLVVQVSKADYESTSVSLTVNTGTTTTTTIAIEKTGSFAGTLRVDRNCIDDGLFLCGDSSIIESDCVNNTDCPYSNHCTVGVNKCSRFNFSACDEAGLPRGERCVAKLVGGNVLDNTTNTFFGNLTYVVIIIIFVVLAGIIFIAWKPNT